MIRKNISSMLIIKNALLASRVAKKVGNRISMHGIGLNEYMVMHYLYDGMVREVPRIELADYLGMSASGVTRLLQPMEKNNIVEKVTNPRDSRQSLVKLSLTGQRLFEEASVSFTSISEDISSKLTLNQQKKLVELYERVL